MRERVEKYKEWFLAKDILNKRTYGIAFCDRFYRDLMGNFDTRGDFDGGDVSIMYVTTIDNITVIVDGDIRRNNADEFLKLIEVLENKILDIGKYRILHL